MKYCQGLVIVIVASYFGTAQCFDLTDLYNWFMGNSKNNAIVAQDCKIVNNRRKCKFNTKSIKMDSENEIELIVDTNGRKIKCSKQLNKANGRWYGSCDGDADDINFIKRVDEDGTESIFGSIHVGNDVCRIHPNVDGEEEIDCVPKNSFKSEDAPKKYTRKELIPANRRRELNSMFGFVPNDSLSETSSTHQRILRGNNQTSNERRRVFDDSGSTIDVLVVWTKAAECANAGLNKGCTVSTATENKMRGLVDLAVEETNTAFELSGIFTSLRLVHAYRDPKYVEKGNGDFYSYLEDVTYENDGNIDDIHEKRALYGADVVQMIVNDDNSCGIAWNDEPLIDWMFSVTHYDCTTGYYSFGHEIGHNFNLLHDRPTEGACNVKNSFNYGYRAPDASFRTILSYDCTKGECDNLPKNGCDRIQRFSNSNGNYKYNGKIIGDATHDNARQFNLEKSTVAAFFPSMDCQSDTECNDNNAQTTDTCDQSNRVCVFASGPARSSPVQPPTRAPVKQPTRAPVRQPTRAPVRQPTRAPVRQPTRVPVKPTTKAPVRTNGPTVADVPIGEQSGTAAPVTAIGLPQSTAMESMKVTGVTSALWKSVALSQAYVSPIPVCTVMYDKGNSLQPAVVRMRNVGSTSFEIILQNPNDVALGARDVHCVVVEEGAWTLADGRFIEAKKYSSTTTDRKGSWIGQGQSYRNKYTNPVVLGQVMSSNDPKWSVFWSRSSSSSLDGPTSSSLTTGKHIGEDPRTTRVAETVGYIVMETLHTKSGTIEFETGRAADVFTGYIGGIKKAHNFRFKFSTTPLIAIVCQAAMDGVDGSWAVLTGNPTTTALSIAVDEDSFDIERLHTTEQVHYAVFSRPGVIPLVKA